MIAGPQTEISNAGDSEYEVV